MNAHRIARHAIVSVVLLAALGATPAQGQSAGQAAAPSSRYGFGVLGGMNSSDLYNPDFVVELREELSGGLFVERRLGGRFGVLLEAAYAPKGATLGDRTLAMDYVEVPLLLTFSASEKGRNRYLFLLGPSMDVKVRTQLEGLPEEQQDYLSDFVRGSAFNVVVGAKVEYGVGKKGALVIEARYSYGLTEVFDAAADDSDSGTRTRTTAAFFGYRF
jgi:hypothetical protein